jgi:hypothetical protein
MAKSYERLGKVDDAISHYQTYVDAPGTTAEDRADALSRIKALKQEQVARDAAAREGEPPAPQLPPENTGPALPREQPARKSDPPLNTTNTTPLVKPNGPILLVVNTRNAVTNLSKDQVRDIYLGKTTVWPNGTRIKPFARQRASQAATVFFGPATGLDAGYYAQQWQQKQLSGAGLAPSTADNPSALLKIVAANEGAIGYVLPNEVPASVEGVRLVELK